MNLPDLINGSFEMVGGCLLWFNSYRILKDKRLKGVFIFPTIFFTFWGFWNLYYYPHLNQILSFVGGCNVVLANTTWVILALYYKRIARRRGG